MTRRQFIGTTAVGLPGFMLARKGDAWVVGLFVIAGGIIVGTGVYMGWKVYKCYKNHFPDPPPQPPPVPPGDGTAVRPPTMPKTNAPPAHVTSSIPVMEGGDISAIDISELGLLLPDSSLAATYCKFDVESSQDGGGWQREATLELWTNSARQSVMKSGDDIQWCPSPNNPWLDLTPPGGGLTIAKKFYRMRQ